MMQDDYKKYSTYESYSDADKQLIEKLRQAQHEISELHKQKILSKFRGQVDMKDIDCPSSNKSKENDGKRKTGGSIKVDGVD